MWKNKKKCNDWAVNLKSRGCHILILIHDLDDRNSSILYKEIESALTPNPIAKTCITIPIKELEAWLLSDANSLLKTFNLKTVPKVPQNPENISSPKEYLEKLITKSSKDSKIYLNTKHNSIIANHLSIKEILVKCNSFKPLHSFIIQHLS